MDRIAIEYSVSCGYLDCAEEVQHELLTNFEHEIERLELVPSESGGFTVSVGGKTVFEASEDGYDIDAILDATYEGLSGRRALEQPGGGDGRQSPIT